MGIMILLLLTVVCALSVAWAAHTRGNENRRLLCRQEDLTVLVGKLKAENAKLDQCTTNYKEQVAHNDLNIARYIKREQELSQRCAHLEGAIQRATETGKMPKRDASGKFAKTK